MVELDIFALVFRLMLAMLQLACTGSISYRAWHDMACQYEALPLAGILLFPAQPVPTYLHRHSARSTVRRESNIPYLRRFDPYLPVGLSTSAAHPFSRGNQLLR